MVKIRNLADVTALAIAGAQNFADLVFLFGLQTLMKRAGLLLTVQVLICTCSLAQKTSADSLRMLTDKAYEYYLSHPDSAIMLIEKSLVRAQETNDRYYEGLSYFLFAKAYWVKANYQLSTGYGFKALKIFQGSTHHEELAATLLALARTLTELGNVQKADDLIHEALSLAREHSEERLEAAAYREHSFLLTETNQLDSALRYADMGIALFRKYNDSLEMSVLYGRKSRIFFQQKKFDESIRYAYQALLIDSLVGNRRGLGIAYYQAAQNENALGNVERAIGLLQNSIRINGAIGNLNWQIRAHELLARLYLQTDQPLLAATELIKVSSFKDELYNSEKSGQIQEMQSLHELEAKENTIDLLEHENNLKQQQVKNQRLFVAFLLVAVLFLVLLTFVLTRLRTIQKKTNRNLARQNIAIEQQKIAIEVQAANLKQLDQIKTKLFSVISHDLRGPISNLQALLDLFTKKLMTADEFISLSGKLKENLNVTQRTLENLLNWSLSQMGGLRTERRNVDLSHCIDESCSLMEDIAARKKITLQRDIHHSLRVWADPDQLQVILRNLIHNAIKFSGFDETVIIKTVHDKKYCHIIVKDRGIGMTPQEIDTVLGSKQYFSKTGTEQEKGTGLGLMLCKEFITGNGGTMDIRSTIGEGTEVSLTLLLAEQETPAQVSLK